jgi:hypothetical protein
VVLEMTAIVSAVAVLIGLVFAGQESRAVSRQLRVANVMSGTSELRAVVTVTHSVLAHLIAKPHLRCYFYDGKEVHDDDPYRSEVLCIAEMYCDALELGLFTTSRIDATESFDCWVDYATCMLQTSPAVRATLREQWWPRLARMYAGLPPPGLDGETPDGVDGRAVAVEAGYDVSRKSD